MSLYLHAAKIFLIPHAGKEENRPIPKLCWGEAVCSVPRQSRSYPSLPPVLAAALRLNSFLLLLGGGRVYRENNWVGGIDHDIR